MNKCLLLISLILSCTKPDLPAPKVCKTVPQAIELEIHLTDQNYLLLIQIDISTDKIAFLMSDHIFPEPGYEHTYNKTIELGGGDMEQADTIFLKYKIFNRGDNSFYFAKADTLIK